MLNNESDEMSLSEFFQKLNSLIGYLKTLWLKIFFVGLIGGAIGFVYAWKQPILYNAKLTFVVEDGKNTGSNLGGLASLAGQIGVDVSGNSSGGLLTGDNILLYFKSMSLAREVLISQFDSMSNKSIADVYASVYGLNDKWLKNNNIGSIKFPTSSSNVKYSRLQDSLIHSIVESILVSSFSVGRTDKKSGFIEVNVNMKDEILSRTYCERVVKIAIDKYISLKTQKQKLTVSKLQERVDSISNLLSKKTATSAALQTSSSTMDINPLYRSGNTYEIESTIRDKSMLATIFGSVVQNLEVAKFNLSQETPVIQIVDTPILPLKFKKTSRLKSLFIGSGILIFLYIFYISLVKYKNYNNG